MSKQNAELHTLWNYFHGVLRKPSKLEWLSLILGVAGILLAIVGFGIAYYQIEAPQLEVVHKIDSTSGTLFISVKNNAWFKETGMINFYRLEVSDVKPHMQLETLKPGENRTLSLAITKNEKNASIFVDCENYPSFVIPGQKLYFVTEDVSMSYKITCDNCYTQGIIRRIPDWQEINVGFDINMSLMDDCIRQEIKNYTISGKLPIYKWVHYTRDDWH